MLVQVERAHNPALGEGKRHMKASFYRTNNKNGQKGIWALVNMT